MKNNAHWSHPVQKLIKLTRKEVTILFTDIEGSGRFWDTRGDTKGRLMVDTHNRLLFPAVRLFRGKIVKTIGDALMATFKKPLDALKAAVAIQQLLHQERLKNPRFPKVRIGIHTGKAVVERGDVFGDTVNVASRIEAKAKGDEILLSARAARKISRKKYPLAVSDRFTPKGKRTGITVFKCHWKRAPDLTKKFKFGSRLLLKPSQKLEILVSALATLGIIAFLYLEYVRYLFTDSEWLALFLLNPKALLPHNPLLIVLCGVAVLSALVWWLKGRSVSLRLFQIFQGGLGFCIVFLLFHILVKHLDLNLGPRAEKVLYRSSHLFVEVVSKEASVHENPNARSATIRTLHRGFLLLLSDVKTEGSTTWNKVLIDRNRYGWIMRIRPPAVGVTEERLTVADKFYFKWKDVYNVICGFVGFGIGFLSFKIRPA